MNLLALFFGLEIFRAFRRWCADNSGDAHLVGYTAAILLVALALFIWAIVFRKPPRHHHHHRRDYPKPGSVKSGGHSESGGWFGRKRRRRRKHRKLNPTLAETGGLPEPRDANKPPEAPI